MVDVRRRTAARRHDRLHREVRAAGLGARYNITLYWLTGTGASAARSYWEAARAQALGAGQTPPPVTVPVGFSAFPGELFQAPRTWVEQAYPTLSYYNKPPRGGHFAAWEVPELFANELRAAFRSLR